MARHSGKRVRGVPIIGGRDEGPSVPLGPVQTVAKVMHGATPAGPMVAVQLVTPLGSHTYLFEPDPARLVAAQIALHADACVPPAALVDPPG